MNIQFKSILFILFCFIATYGESAASQAKNTQPMISTPQSCSQVFLCSPSYTFEIDFTALILQPTGSNLHYAAEAIPIPVPSPNWKIFEIHPDYHFGFDIGLGGIFHNINTALTLNWQRFHSTDSASKTVSPENMIGPFFSIGPDAAPFTHAHGHAIFHFDAVHLDYGLFVNFGHRLQTTLFSGISFTRIKQSLLSRFLTNDRATFHTIKTPSIFTGAGPELGVDFSYRIIEGFHFTGETAISFLIGTMKNHTAFKALSPDLKVSGVTPPNKQRTTVHERTQVVPAFKGSLALAYSYTFCDDYMLKLEAGYQAQIYINAIQSVDMGSEVPTFIVPETVGVFARTFQRTISNFALAGPYLTLTFGF